MQNNAPSNTVVAESVRAIKNLQRKVNNLQTENEQLKTELADAHKRYNDVLTREVTVSENSGVPVACPNATNETITALQAQLAALRRRSDGGDGYDSSSVEKEDFNTIIQDFRNKLALKDQEIASLQQNCSERDLKSKVSCLNDMLHRARAANQVFADEIETLQLQLVNVDEDKTQSNEDTTQVHAPSDDDILNGSGSTPCATEIRPPCFDMIPREELEATKKLNLQLQEKLNNAVGAQEVMRKELLDKENEIKKMESQLNELQLTNVTLRSQVNSQRNSSNDVVETQLKAFMEDFALERQEKAQVVDQNNMLRDQLERLNQTLYETRQRSSHSAAPRNLQYTPNTMPNHRQPIPAYDVSQAHPYSSPQPNPTSTTYSRQQSNSQLGVGPARYPPAPVQPLPQRRIAFPTNPEPVPAIGQAPGPMTAPIAYVNDPNGPSYIGDPSGHTLFRGVSHPGYRDQRMPPGHLQSDHLLEVAPQGETRTSRASDSSDAGH